MNQARNSIIDWIKFQFVSYNTFLHFFAHIPFQLIKLQTLTNRKALKKVWLIYMKFQSLLLSSG